ncbi:MAG: transglycosylase SLT domain-containing protein [Oceanospirillaceae bacterium]|nr:transglycosylase SLT domain-containing protein [Oceanospirillaceae bacterium]
MATKYDPEIHGEFTEEMLRREAEIKQEFKARKMGLTVPYDPEIHGAIEDIDDLVAADVEFIRGDDGRMLRLSGAEVFDARTGTKLGKEVVDKKVRTHGQQSVIPKGFKVYEPVVSEIPMGFKPYKMSVTDSDEPSEMERPDFDEDYLNQLAQVESSGNPKAKSKTSSATGLYQFINSTWLENVREMGIGKGKTEAEILAMRTDPDISTEVVKHFTKKNVAKLKDAGIKIKDGTLYMAHFAGVNTAIRLYSADPSEPASSVFSQRAIDANPSILNGKTVGDVINWASRKMGRDVAVSEAAETVSPQISPSTLTPFGSSAKITEEGYYQGDDGEVYYFDGSKFSRLG